MPRKLLAGLMKLPLKLPLGKEMDPGLLQQEDIKLQVHPKLHQRGQLPLPRPLLGRVKAPDIMGGQPKGPTGPLPPLLDARRHLEVVVVGAPVVQLLGLMGLREPAAHPLLVVGFEVSSEG